MKNLSRRIFLLAQEDPFSDHLDVGGMPAVAYPGKFMGRAFWRLVVFSVLVGFVFIGLVFAGRVLRRCFNGHGEPGENVQLRLKDDISFGL
jgi:hypothetical protein